MKKLLVGALLTLALNANAQLVNIQQDETGTIATDPAGFASATENGESLRMAPTILTSQQPSKEGYTKLVVMSIYKCKAKVGYIAMAVGVTPANKSVLLSRGSMQQFPINGNTPQGAVGEYVCGRPASEFPEINKTSVRV